MPPTTPDKSEQLLEENLAIAKDTNRILRAMRRDAWLGLIAKVVLWLVILGVPIFFLSTYLGPLMSAFSPEGATTQPTGPFGLPSEAEINNLIEQYKELQR